ncbi:aquaporin-9 [Rhinophrynus dorsalis]
MAVTMAIYASGGVSGGHINPAVSFAMCLTGRLKWSKFPFYVSAQFLGAMTGSAAVFGVYHDAIYQYTGGILTVHGPNATAHIFATYPSPYLSVLNGFADQVMATALLLIMVFAIFDSKNIGAPKGLEPIAVGLLILLLGLSMGMNSGCAMNPARDLGPRIFTALAGWGTEVFTRMSKKPWGTISPAPFPLGHQTISNSEIQQVVQRLHSSPRCTRCSTTSPLQRSKSNKSISPEKLRHLLERLTKHSEEKGTDSKRTAVGAIKEMGVVNSYAWKGWN